jgi:Flp pilus assembly protein TadG
MPTGRRSDRGAAVVDFVLVLVVLIPLFLGILQVALVLHVRNTLTAAASEGARYAGTLDRPVDAGAARTREQITGALAGRFARHVAARSATVAGAPGVEVDVTADVPPLGIWGPGVRLHVSGHAVEEVAP